MGELLVRERVSRRIAESASFPLTVIAAKAGYGKSIALSHYLESVDAGVIRFDVRRRHGSLTRFVRGFAAVLEPSLPRVAQSLAIAHERAVQSKSSANILATWLAEHLEDRERLIVIDDYQHCEGDAEIAKFLASAIARTRGTVRWMIATRSTADLPIATWLAHRDTDVPLDETTFRLENDEAHRIAERLAPALDGGVVDLLHAATNGAPSAYAFGLRTLRARPGAAERLLAGTADPFERFASETMQSLAPCERALVLETSVFPEVDSGLFAAAGYDDAAERLASVERAAPYLFIRRDGVVRYHQLFTEMLARQLQESGSDALRAANLRAARALEQSNRIVESLVYFMREREFGEIVRIVEQHGFAFIESGYGESMHEAIAALDPFVQMGNSVVLAIRAIAESRSGRFDTAEAWFQLASDRAANPALRAHIGFQYCSHLLRFFRPEAIERLEALVTDPHATCDLRAYALASLGPAYVFAKRLDEAERSVEAALVFAASSTNDHLYAKAHHQASYVALYAGNAARAKALAHRSLARANERGCFDVAASALSVLYNVAADIDDDPRESLRLLETMGDCAAKSGSLTEHLVALVASLEIEVERGAEDEAVRIDAKMRALDATCSGRLVYEVLLPTQALRASWRGDFAGAHRLLASSADEQWSPDRKALRHAEIAFYAAAAGLREEASNAIRVALETLEPIGTIELRVQRARLFLAFALMLMGRNELARETLDLVDRSPEAISDRLRSLRDLARSLCARYRGHYDPAALLASFRELAACHFGGIGRTIMSLPLADNAIGRIDRLSMDERAAVLTWADGDGRNVDPRIATVCRKLGCDRVGARRAVVRHRAAFESETFRRLHLREALA